MFNKTYSVTKSIQLSKKHLTFKILIPCSMGSHLKQKGYFSNNVHQDQKRPDFYLEEVIKNE
jgi:hypothetical protein